MILFTKTLTAGRKSMGIEAGDNFFSIGKPFDAVVFDASAPLLAGQNFDHLLSSIIYTGGPAAMLGTLVNGKWIIKQGQHAKRDAILNRFTHAVRSLGR
jgi:formimidoylglutamate deiminase